MDPTLLALMGISTALPYIFGNSSSPPDQPSPQWPDANLLNEFGSINDWTNMNRQQWLADFYGGKAQNNRLDAPVEQQDWLAEDFMKVLTGGATGSTESEFKDYLMEDLTPSEMANIAAANPPLPTRRWEATFTGTKPAEQYMAAQSKVYGDSAAGFGNEMANYLKQRGIAEGDVVSGTKSELKQDYDQKAKEIASKSSDIYMQTLGNLFGEVSDAGQQAAQLSGLSAQASQNWSGDMDRRYQQQMALWQNAQNAPANGWASAAGSMLPYLAMGMMGSGGGQTSPDLQLQYRPNNQFNLTGSGNYWPYGG